VGAKQQYTKKYGDQLARELYKWIADLAKEDDPEKATRLLFIERFCANYGFPRRRLQDLKTRSKEFGLAYELFCDVQRTVMQEGGLLGNYNSRITTLLLSHEHNVRQKVDAESPLSGQLSALEQMMDEDDDG